MTPLSLEQVRHVAKLARLRLSAAEEEKARGELQQILDAVATLQQLDTTGVEPTYQVNLSQGLTRADEPGATLSVDAALANAPQRVGGHFAVPKIID